MLSQWFVALSFALLSSPGDMPAAQTSNGYSLVWTSTSAAAASQVGSMTLRAAAGEPLVGRAEAGNFELRSGIPFDSTLVFSDDFESEDLCAWSSQVNGAPVCP